MRSRRTLSPTARVLAAVTLVGIVVLVIGTIADERSLIITGLAICLLALFTLVSAALGETGLPLSRGRSALLSMGRTGATNGQPGDTPAPEYVEEAATPSEEVWERERERRREAERQRGQDAG